MKYPPSLILGDDGKFDLAIAADADILSYDDVPPGIPYARDAAGGGVAILHRVELLTCKGCNAPLKLVQETINGHPRKTFHCGTPSCRRVWHLQLVREPGGREMLALVLKTL